MKNLSVLLFFILSHFSFAQTHKQNYSQYHRKINKAETLFFIEKKVDSALYYYDNVFTAYDFIFVKDLINAAQIAAYSKKPYQKYIEQGFEQGLKISHLKEYPLLNKFYTTAPKNKKLLQTYETNRKKYRERIDFTYLDFTYKMAIRDQTNKHEKKSHASYIRKVSQITERIKDSIKKRGFPGDRTIGISDSTIFKEIKKSQLDLYNQRKYNKELWHMTSDEKELNAKYTVIIYLHNPCSYDIYKKILYKEMLKGNIHPRDIALLHDHPYSYRKSLRSGCGNKDNQAYLINKYANYPKEANLTKTNEMRKELFIVPTYVDDKKREHEKEYGFNLFSGFWSCR